MKPAFNAGRSVPVIRLSRREAEFVVHPPAETGLDEFAFATTPTTLVEQCAAITAAVWERYERCMGLVLSYNCRSHDWIIASPQQRCARETCSWTVGPASYPEKGPEIVLAGSFQSRVLRSDDDAWGAVPASHGLHFVRDFGFAERPIWCFIRFGADRLASLPLPDVISKGLPVIGDVEAILASIRPQLKFV